MHTPVNIFYLQLSLVNNTQSLKVEGNPSSALTTIYFSADFSSIADLHLMWVGNPAPPLPYNPLFLISSQNLCPPRVKALSAAAFKLISLKKDKFDSFSFV